MKAIRANDPTGTDGLARDRDAARADAADRRAPQHAHAGRGRRFHHLGMEDGTAHPERISFGKHGLNGNAAVHESNAAEGLRVRTVQRNPETAQSGQAIGHQAFAACFVDGRACAVRECDMQSLAARGDGGRQPGRSTPDNEYVS
jgi:hypothetical protein